MCEAISVILFLHTSFMFRPTKDSSRDYFVSRTQDQSSLGPHAVRMFILTNSGSILQPFHLLASHAVVGGASGKDCADAPSSPLERPRAPAH